MPDIFHQHLLKHRVHYTEMNEMYISLSLRALTIGIAGIFVPIYLHELGYSLAMIGVFYLIATLPRLGVEFVTATLVSRFGPKHTMVASFILLLMFYLTLYAAADHPWLFYLAAVILAVETSFFWLSKHTQLVFNRSSEHASTQIGITVLLQKLFGALGPFIGGVIAAVFGIQYILLVAAAALVFAMYPLLKTEDRRNGTPFQMREFRPIPLWRSDGMSQIAHQVNNVVSTHLWPLYMFLFLGALEKLGAILSASIIGGIMLTYYIGRLGDKGFNHTLLRAGALIKSLVHLARMFVHGFGGFLSVTLLNDMSQTLLSGPFLESHYEKANQDTDPYNYIVSSNLIATIAKTLLWSLVIASAVFFEDETVVFTSGFIVAAVATLFMPRIIHTVPALKR